MLPVRVNVPVPVCTRPPLPPMVPPKVVLALLPPVVRVEPPSTTLPLATPARPPMAWLPAALMSSVPAPARFTVLAEDRLPPAATARVPLLIVVVPV
ncbi:hypothetical protein D3C75_1047650 [compost metagenome]